MRDLYKDDVGRLNTWRLTIDYDVSDYLISAEKKPGLPIPDNQVSGVESDLAIVDTGIITAIEVQVSITHSYVGDLQIELISPSGETALLRSADWRRGTNLNATYTSKNTPTLQSLIGEHTIGIWMLRVKDLAGYDIGTLDSWAIKLTAIPGENVADTTSKENVLKQKSRPPEAAN